MSFSFRFSNIPAVLLVLVTLNLHVHLYHGELPTASPSQIPSQTPSQIPTKLPSKSPTKFPTLIPSNTPTDHPTYLPTLMPTLTKCDNFLNDEDTYRICKIFEDSVTYSTNNWFLNETISSNICNWTDKPTQVECDYIRSIGETRLIGLSVSFYSGSANFSNAWPEYMEWIDISGTIFLTSNWYNFSSLPNSVYSITLSGSGISGYLDSSNINTLPRSLEH